MSWRDQFGSPAHGAYGEGDRCPVCLVPPLAPHLNSCDYHGIWNGASEEEPHGNGGWSE